MNFSDSRENPYFRLTDCASGELVYEANRSLSPDPQASVTEMLIPVDSELGQGNTQIIALDGFSITLKAHTTHRDAVLRGE